MVRKRTWMAGTSPAMTNHGRDVGAKQSSSPRPAMTTFDNRRFMRAVTMRRTPRRTAPSPSCAALCRVSTSSLAAEKNVDGRDKPGHDEPRPGHPREAKLVASPGHDERLTTAVPCALSRCPQLRKRRAAQSPSCPALCRASTSSLAAEKNVDGRDKPGHDEPRPGRRREAKLVASPRP